MKTMDTNEEISEIKRSLSELELRQIQLTMSYRGLVDSYKEFAACYKETVDTMKEIAGLSNETTKALGLIAVTLKEMADDKLKSKIAYSLPRPQCKDCKYNVKIPRPEGVVATCILSFDEIEDPDASCQNGVPMGL